MFPIFEINAVKRNCEQCRRRNSSNWTDVTSPTKLYFARGYTGHEHLEPFNTINMNGRIYDPVLARIMSPDNYVQDGDNPLNYDRYAYCWNNPLKFTDPSGDFVFTLACLIAAPFTASSSLAFLPAAIGADLGAWQGGTFANGTSNPFKWNYSSGSTWRSMVGGAIVGGVSGGVGSGIATSGSIIANTAATIVGSSINSVGFSTMSDGVMNPSISFGFGSYNLETGEFGYLGKDGNSVFENVCFGLGALGNLGDLAKITDSFTHWEQKLANMSKNYMDNWVKKHPDAVVDFATLYKNAGRSYPSYLGKNPKIMGTTDDFMGMIEGWNWKEYAGYLHDAEYIGKRIQFGAKYLLGSYYTYGADIRLMARTLYLGLKHNSPFELLTGSMIGTINAIKIPYGWLVRKPL